MRIDRKKRTIADREDYMEYQTKKERLYYKSRIRERNRLETFIYNHARHTLRVRVVVMETDSRWPHGVRFVTFKAKTKNVSPCRYFSMMGEYNRQGILEYIRGVYRKRFLSPKQHF